MQVTSGAGADPKSKVPRQCVSERSGSGGGSAGSFFCFPVSPTKETRARARGLAPFLLSFFPLSLSYCILCCCCYCIAERAILWQYRAALSVRTVPTTVPWKVGLTQASSAFISTPSYLLQVEQRPVEQPQRPPRSAANKPSIESRSFAGIGAFAFTSVCAPFSTRLRRRPSAVAIASATRDRQYR